MRKVPTLFTRGDDGFVVDDVTPGCEWVLAGEGTATIQFDGVAVRLNEGGALDVRVKVAPEDVPNIFEQTDVEDDGRVIGWAPANLTPLAAKVEEALERTLQWYDGQIDPGTFELVGGDDNTDQVLPWLMPHDQAPIIGNYARTYDDLRDQLVIDFALTRDEGIVWQHPDGRWAKLKRADFDLSDAAIAAAREWRHDVHPEREPAKVEVA